MKNTILILLSFLPFIANGQNIKTFAGNGTAIFAGDGGPATAASINEPCGITFDHYGNTYIVDQFNYRVRKISSSGIITTVAGTGVPGFSGDGGPATLAQIARSINIVADTSGNLFLADRYNNRVRKISALGVISTVAGSSSAGYGGDGGPATLASLNNPTGVALDQSGNLYIADNANNCVRKVSPSGMITTVAGTGFAGSTGDGGPATAATLHQVWAVTVDTAGNLYLSDQQNNKIRKVSAGGIISTFAGTGVSGFSGDGGAATAAELSNPCAVAIDQSGNIFIADQINNRVRMVSPAGIISTVAGTGVAGYSGDGGPATAAEINSTSEINIDPAGRLFICDNNNQRIRVFSGCEIAIVTQPQPDTVFEGTNAIFSVTTVVPAPNYQWQEDPGTGFVDLANVWPYSGVNSDSLIIHNASPYLNLTHYRCVISDELFCSDTTISAVLVVRTPTSLTKTTFDGTLKVAPNPANGISIVTISGNYYRSSLLLMNSLGQEVFSSEIENGQQKLDLSELPKGIYVLKVVIDGNVYCSKVIKS